MRPPVRVAFVGAGAMARAHAHAFRDVPGVVLSGLCSRRRPQAAALAGEVGIDRVADSIGELHEATGADLVVVAVPELAAFDVGLACLQFPWTVLLEKPPGHTLAEATHLLAAARAGGRRVFVGLNRRCYGSTRAALADLAGDPAPRFIHVQDQQDLDEARALGQPEAVVARWMYANSIHLVDYLPLFGRGAIDTVTPIVPWRGDGRGIVLALLRFSSGDLGLYEGVWGGPGPWAVSISTASRRWELRPLEEATVQRAGSRSREAVPRQIWDRTFKPGVRLQAEELVSAVRGGAAHLATLDAAVATMRAIAAIFDLEPGA